jgi:cyclopropane-fatty-acyl-phospholipid synthase
MAVSIISRRAQVLERILRKAGVELNGPNPWDIQVNDERLYDRILSHGDLGIGESYVNGWWDCPRIDELTCRILSHRLLEHVKNDWRMTLAAIRGRLFNLQTVRRAAEVAEKHYDLGNEFFETLLGPTMVYSCAYWKHTAHLDQAQHDKLELICQKLQLDKRDRVLDIGCGWGALARHVAQKYGCRVMGVTISQQQVDYATRLCKGLPVNVLLADYRAESLKPLGPFNKIVSVGMFEHVGSKNYRKFMETVHSLLTGEGLFLLHTIGTHRSAPGSAWVKKYIFPNSEIPSFPNVAQAIDDLFIMEDWHNFGADYDKTLMAWYENFEKGVASRAFATDPTFRRTWRYYLLSCAGIFRARNVTQLWQVALSKNGVRYGYSSVR